MWPFPQLSIKGKLRGRVVASLAGSPVLDRSIDRTQCKTGLKGRYTPQCGFAPITVKRHQRTSSELQPHIAPIALKSTGFPLTQCPTLANFGRTANASPDTSILTNSPANWLNSKVRRRGIRSSSGGGDDCNGGEEVVRNIKLAFCLLKKPPVTKISFYSISKELGHGAFGKVYLATHKLTELKVAIKFIDKSRLKDESARLKVEREVRIFRHLTHKNIVTLFEVFEDSRNCYIVMEYCGKGDLLNFVRNKGRLREYEAREIFKQLVEGTNYMHAQGVLHRDLKLENVLLNSALNTVKLCDFGISRFVEIGVPMHEQCGTPAYLAPEILYKEEYTGFASDTWSLGVILYAMCVGKMPFKGKSLEDQRQILKTSCLAFPDTLSDSLKELLSSMLCFNPMSRTPLAMIFKQRWFSAPLEGSLTMTFNCCVVAEKDDVLAESLIDQVTTYCFPKKYVVKSVKDKAMNHAAATYMLLHSNS